MLRNIIGLVIIGLLFVIAVNTQSQEPPPSPGELGKPIQEHTPNKQQVSDTDKRGTEQFPFVVKTINPTKSQTEADEERKERDEKSANDRKLVWFTAGLVLVTAVLAGIAVWQGCQMRRSVDSQCRAERAYVFVTIRRYPDIKPGEIIEGIAEGFNQARITATNHGKTPATIVKLNYELGVFNDAQINIEFLKTINESTSKIIPEIIAIRSGEDREFSAGCDVSIQDERNINYSTVYFYCFGRIEYRDIFDKFHNTLFCWRDSGIFFEPDPDPKRNKRT